MRFYDWRKNHLLINGVEVTGWATGDDVLKIESSRARIRRVQESLRKFIPSGRILSGELIADRREEAQREMEEWLG